MLRIFCKSKLSNATVTETSLYYHGSIGIDKDLMECADILEGEQVQVLNVNNGERITTYVIEEEAGSGKIVLYGPAARRGEVGDDLVILAYCFLGPEECHSFKKITVDLDKDNKTGDDVKS